MRAVSSLQVLTPICLTKTGLASFLGFLTNMKTHTSYCKSCREQSSNGAYFLNEIGILTLVAEN